MLPNVIPHHILCVMRILLFWWHDTHSRLVEISGVETKIAANVNNWRIISRQAIQHNNRNCFPSYESNLNIVYTCDFHVDACLFYVRHSLTHQAKIMFVQWKQMHSVPHYVDFGLLRMTTILLESYLDYIHAPFNFFMDRSDTRGCSLMTL